METTIMTRYLTGPKTLSGPLYYPTNAPGIVELTPRSAYYIKAIGGLQHATLDRNNCVIGVILAPGHPIGEQD
jgi:hypothetical protein